MAEIEGDFTSRKDPRAALRIGKNSRGDRVVWLLTDLGGTGKYKVRYEGPLREGGGQFTSEAVSPDGRKLPIEIEPTSDGVRLTFVYEAGAAEGGMDTVEVVDYTRRPDQSFQLE